MAFCHSCGKELAPDMKFCGNCGAPQPQGVASQYQSQPPTQPVQYSPPPAPSKPRRPLEMTLVGYVNLAAGLVAIGIGLLLLGVSKAVAADIAVFLLVLGVTSTGSGYGALMRMPFTLKLGPFAGVLYFALGAFFAVIGVAGAYAKQSGAFNAEMVILGVMMVLIGLATAYFLTRSSAKSYFKS